MLCAKRCLLHPEQVLAVGHLRQFGQEAEPCLGDVLLSRRYRQRVHERLGVLDVRAECALDAGVGSQHFHERRIHGRMMRRRSSSLSPQADPAQELPALPKGGKLPAARVAELKFLPVRGRPGRMSLSPDQRFAAPADKNPTPSRGAGRQLLSVSIVLFGRRLKLRGSCRLMRLPYRRRPRMPITVRTPARARPITRLRRTMHDHPSPAMPRLPHAAVIAVLLVAALARAARIMHGLPDFLEEAIPLRQALEMVDPVTRRVDLNPHFFNYPSLSIYLHLVVQALVFAGGLVVGAWHNPADYILSWHLDPTLMVAVARGLSVAVDLVAIVAVMRIAERLMRGSGWVAGLIAAVSPLLIVTSSSIFCDGLMAAAGLWAVERTLAWCDGDARWPRAAAVLIGLAAGAKYPGALLLLPLGAAMVLRDGRRALPRWVACAALSLAVFVATTPFAVLAWPEFVRDLTFEGGHAAEGHLGGGAGPAGLWLLERLVADLGWAVALAAALSFVAPALARRSPRDTLVVLVAVAAAFVPIAAGRIEAARYLVLTAFLVTALAAATIVAASARFPQGVRLAVTLAAISWPLLLSSRLLLESPTTTQVLARRWCEAHVPSDALILQEAYGAHLYSRALVEATRRTPEFAAASAALQDRISALRAFHVVTLPLVVAGRWNGQIEGPSEVRGAIRAFERAVDLNRIFYEPAIFAGADYVVTSSAVRDRLIADSLRVPQALALHRRLERQAPVAARFEPRGRIHGPRIVVYRIDPATRAALAGGGGLDPLWWTRSVPSDYADRVAARLGVDAMRPGTDGAPALWVRTLALVFDSKVGPFASEMAITLASLGRYELALPFARAVHAMHPGDLGACAVASVAARRIGDPALALGVLDRTRAAVAAMPPELDLETARAQVACGRRAEGARLLTRLIARLDSTGAVAEQAMRELTALRESGPRAEVARPAQAATEKARSDRAATKSNPSPTAARANAKKAKTPLGGSATFQPGR